MNTSKLTYLLSFLLVTFLGFSVHAQDYTFKVVSKKGTASVGGAELKVGSKIQDSESIVVGSGAVLNIAHSNGKSINISKPGTYKAADLAKGCSAQSGSLAGKYADFVLKELTSGDGDAVGAKNMKKPGSVTRDITGPNAPSFAVMTYDKKTMVAPGTKVVLRWFAQDNMHVEDGKTQYTLVIQDFAGTVLSETVVKESYHVLDLSEDKYASAMGGAFKYYVYANGDATKKSDVYVLQVLKKTEASQVKQDVEMLSEDNSALGKLILGRYFEDQQLFVNAMYAYEEALKMSDNDEQYKAIYEAFLDRNYMSKKAKKELADDQAKKDGANN